MTRDGYCDQPSYSPNATAPLHFDLGKARGLQGDCEPAERF
jgi:hypothetical protein